eukprot:gene7051-9626_t
MNQDDVIKETVKVYVRQRPYLVDEKTFNEKADPQFSNGVKSIVADKANQRIICTYYSATTKSNAQFSLDNFYDEESSQKQIYDDTAAPIVESALKGYSGTILAYGPTSSGKTYTMRGTNNNAEQGIIVRCLNRILEEKSKGLVEVFCSYVQIYCETITDLLVPMSISNELESLSIREKNNQVYVEGMNRISLSSIDDLITILSNGDANRNTASTNMNATSSRSHAILMINIIILNDYDNENDESNVKSDKFGVHKESTLMLVDLAGSERYSASEGKDYMRLEEAKAINLSLSALGNCMSALAESKSHIPYRDSKLTRLLQNCLGGSSRTCFIVNIPPGDDINGEIFNSLRFASRASKVKVSAKISRVKDYESLYNDAKKKLELLESKNNNKIDNINNNEKENSELIKKNSIIDQQTAEIEALRMKLSIYQSTESIMKQTDIIGNRDVTSSSLVNDDLQSKIKEINTAHSKSLEDVHNSYQIKIKQLQQSKAILNDEISELRDDLNAERQRHLATIQDLRLFQQKKSKSESDYKERISELLEELSDRRSVLEDLQQENENLKKQILSLQNDMKEVIENTKDMVTKDKVKEMEDLFVETVSKLSKRVNMLENQSSQPSTGNNQYSGELSSRISRIEPGGRVRSSNSMSNQQPSLGIVNNNNNNNNSSMRNGNRVMSQSSSVKTIQEYNNYH